MEDSETSDSRLEVVRVRRVQGAEVSEATDVLAVEEPLEIRLAWEVDGRREQRPVSVTMRTPGNDRELAVGFLFSEGVVSGFGQISKVHMCGSGNVVRVHLKSGSEVDWSRLERHFYTSSSCGVCGKTSIEAVRVAALAGRVSAGPEVEASLIPKLPRLLREAQAVFNRTGGLHASALFDGEGRLMDVREDVGRHNALDKLIGAQVLGGHMPLTGRILLLSGRASFELVQKAAMAGIPIVAAVGAPSSLAVKLAVEHEITLLGFVRRSGSTFIPVLVESEAPRAPRRRPLLRKGDSDVAFAPVEVAPSEAVAAVQPAVEGEGVPIAGFGGHGECLPVLRGGVRAAHLFEARRGD